MLHRARKLASSTLGDALDHHGLHGVMSGIARRSGAGRVAGYALTMQEQVAPLGSFSFNDFAVGKGFDTAAEDTVLVVDMGGADVSTFGGLAALTLSLRKAAGAVIDGGCRDIEDIVQSGLTVASRSVTPRTGKGRARIVSVGEPICCGGISVRTGDLIVIDDTGLVVIPLANIGAVLETAETLEARDRDFAQRLRNGAGFSDAAAALTHA